MQRVSFVSFGSLAHRIILINQSHGLAKTKGQANQTKQKWKFISPPFLSASLIFGKFLTASKNLT